MIKRRSILEALYPWNSSPRKRLGGTVIYVADAYEYFVLSKRAEAIRTAVDEIVSTTLQLVQRSSCVN